MDRNDYRVIVKAPGGAVIGSVTYRNILHTDALLRANTYGWKVMRARDLAGEPKVKVERLAGEKTQPVSLGLF